MSDIREGDVVVRVSGERRFMRRGVIARVSGLCHNHKQGHGLLFDEHSIPPIGWCACFEPENFRKIEAPKTELSERIRKCRPVPAKVEETALDRLAARLGEGLK